EEATDVYCLLETSPNGEKGWTCKDQPWSARNPYAPANVVSYLPATKSNRGKGYYALAYSARNTMSTDKAEFFELTAQNTKVIY
ncbi:MAG: hypothetical protein JXR45_11445, partial [Deltaproteobacteria bacterium]|nr:hypothetical protein [Deltaproteobacteria bacterium]